VRNVVPELQRLGEAWFVIVCFIDATRCAVAALPNWCRKKDFFYKLLTIDL
jgi:hypothetical protein